MTDSERAIKIKNAVKSILIMIASFEAGIYYTEIRDILLERLNELLGMLS